MRRKYLNAEYEENGLDFGCRILGSQFLSSNKYEKEIPVGIV